MIDKNPSLIGGAGESLREAFGKKLTEIADRYPNLVVLDGDVAGGTGAHHFRKSNPSRFYQFGIAEQNMICAAAGMAATGLIPVVTTFAVFSMRAYEQTRLSIAYANRNVKIVASHPGLDVGPDGASAQALEDIAAFRAIPGMVVISPADTFEMALAIEAILDYEGPVYMRTGRSPARRLFSGEYIFKIGKGNTIREGTDVSIIACGVEVARALDAADILSAEGVSARVINMATIKPLDVDLIRKCAIETGAIVTAEDHNVYGGLGGAVAEAVVKISPVPMELVGVLDTFGESGEPEELAKKYCISAQHIAQSAINVIKRKSI